MIHSVIKRKFKEISVCKAQGRKSTLACHDLLSLRWHCIKNRPDSIVEIIEWSQQHFRKPLSANTVRHCIHNCKLKPYHVTKKPYIHRIQKHRCLFWAPAHLRWTEVMCKSGPITLLHNLQNVFT